MLAGKPCCDMHAASDQNAGQPCVLCMAPGCPVPGGSHSSPAAEMWQRHARAPCCEGHAGHAHPHHMDVDMLLGRRVRVQHLRQRVLQLLHPARRVQGIRAQAVQAAPCQRVQVPLPELQTWPEGRCWAVRSGAGHRPTWAPWCWAPSRGCTLHDMGCGTLEGCIVAVETAAAPSTAAARGPAALPALAPLPQLHAGLYVPRRAQCQRAQRTWPQTRRPPRWPA